MNQMSGRGLRTLDEIRVGAVTINITIDTQESSLSPAEASTVRQVNEMLDESRELVEFKNRVIDGVSSDRERERERGDRLADELAEEKRQREANREWAERAEKRAERAEKRLKAELVTQRQRGDRLADELASERQRNAELKDRLAVADESRTEMNQRRNAAWQRASELNKTLAELEQSLAERDRLLQQATHQLSLIALIVNDGKVNDAMDRRLSLISGVLAETIESIREVLSASPDTDTSVDRSGPVTR